MIQKNIRFESQKIEGKDWADNLGKKFSFFMLFPYRLYNSYKKIGHFVCSKRVGERTENTPKHVAMNYLSELIDLDLIMLFLRIWTLYGRGKKWQKTKITKFLGPKANKKGNKNKKYKAFGGQRPQSKFTLNSNGMGHYPVPFLT